jgi:hypothetical protein
MNFIMDRASPGCTSQASAKHGDIFSANGVGFGKIRFSECPVPPCRNFAEAIGLMAKLVYDPRLADQSES